MTDLGMRVIIYFYLTGKKTMVRILNPHHIEIVNGFK